MAQSRLKGTVVPAADKIASNPLQDSFIKLDQAEQLRQQGKLDRAQTICESLVRQYPDYMAALHTLGLIHADKKNYQRALDALVRAAMLNPRSWKTLTALSGVYLRLDASEMAALALEQAKAINPNDAGVLVTLGEIYREEREYELAYDAYRDAAKLDPSLVPAALGSATICMHLGRYAEAAHVLEDLIERGMLSIDVLHGLAGLPAGLIHVDVLTELDKVVRSETAPDAEFAVLAAFNRVAALDKQGRYAEAWEHLVPANRAMLAKLAHELKERTESERASLASLRNAHIKARNGASADRSPVSLFILGPSRSGKTTLEKLVGTLDGVKRGYENPSVEIAVRRTFQTAGLLTSNWLGDLPSQLHSLCRETYLEELARRAGPARVFTNTHPARIHDVVQMVGVFPNVRCLFVKRNVEDDILRIYMRQYTRGNAYAYDLKAARDHVLWYHHMIDVLAQKLPDLVRVIRYEDMVADPAAALHVAADLCGLAVPDSPVPEIGDDRGCSDPYRQFMAALA